MRRDGGWRVKSALLRRGVGRAAVRPIQGARDKSPAASFDTFPNGYARFSGRRLAKFAQPGPCFGSGAHARCEQWKTAKTPRGGSILQIMQSDYRVEDRLERRISGGIVTTFTPRRLASRSRAAFAIHRAHRSTTKFTHRRDFGTKCHEFAPPPGFVVPAFRLRPAASQPGWNASSRLPEATAPPAEAGARNFRASLRKATNASEFIPPFHHRISQPLLEKCFTFFFHNIFAGSRCSCSLPAKGGYASGFVQGSAGTSKVGSRNGHPSRDPTELRFV